MSENVSGLLVHGSQLLVLEARDTSICEGTQILEQSGSRQAGEQLVRGPAGGCLLPPRDHANVTPWIRAYDDESDTWSYFELSDEGWALRQVDLQGPQRRPVTAASLAEVVEVRDHDDLAAMAAYERKYGVLAEGSLHGWQDAGGAAEITQYEFESTWAAARETLDAKRTEETS